MTTFDAARPMSTARPGARILSPIIALAAAVTTWNDQRMTRRSLAKLTDRELDDIGLVRSDIERF